MSETDAAEAKRRAEWLHKHNAHKDWIILSVSEIAVIKDELSLLERERDEAREVASGLSIQEERVNEAQKELSSIHRWIDKNHADGFIDSLTYLQNLERVTDSWYDRIDAIETDARRFVRERDEARKHWKEIEEYGTEEINAAVDLRQKLAFALLERDEAREDAKRWQELCKKLSPY
jgi:hypothetical protein